MSLSAAKCAPWFALLISHTREWGTAGRPRETGLAFAVSLQAVGNGLPKERR